MNTSVASKLLKPILTLLSMKPEFSQATATVVIH